MAGGGDQTLIPDRSARSIGWFARATRSLQTSSRSRFGRGRRDRAVARRTPQRRDRVRSFSQFTGPKRHTRPAVARRQWVTLRHDRTCARRSLSTVWQGVRSSRFVVGCRMVVTEECVNTPCSPASRTCYRRRAGTGVWQPCCPVFAGCHGWRFGQIRLVHTQ